MANIDESCSPAMLFTSEELDITLPVTDAAAKSRDKRKVGHDVLTTSRRITPSAVTIVPKPKRAKFEPWRRQQVANVRKKGPV